MPTEDLKHEKRCICGGKVVRRYHWGTGFDCPVTTPGYDTYPAVKTLDGHHCERCGIQYYIEEDQS